jgi:hypothetical protein
MFTTRQNRILVTLLTVVCGLSLILFLSSCSQPTKANAVSVTGPISYDGVWKSTGDVNMTATISGDHIQIDWAMNSGTTGLYWVGTFPSTTPTIISTADVEALSSSMVGSLDKTKTFTYKDGTLSYNFQILGITKLVTLKR